MPKIEFANKIYTGVELDPLEEAKLELHVKSFIGGENNFLRSLFNYNWEYIKGALMVAKEKFDAPFRGMLASDNEIGVQLTRPGHILRTAADSTETASNDWTFTFTADADYWIGFYTDNTTAVNIDKECLILWMGIQFTGGVNPVVEELLLQIGATTFPVIVVRHAWQADNLNRIRAMRIHPVLLEPKATALCKTYSIIGGVNELVVVGLTFGFGRYLRKASYTTIST